MFHFENFHDRTFADFEPADTPDREPDFISRSGSVYWNEPDRVIRLSDHWGRVRSCYWLYSGLRTAIGERAAACNYADFGRLERLTVERDRTIPVAPGSRPSLTGKTVSLVPKSGVRQTVRVIEETPFRIRVESGQWLPRLSARIAWLIDG